MANVKRPPMIHGGKKNYDSFQSHQENDYEITRMIYLLFEIKSRGSVVISGSQDSSESSVAGCQNNIDIQVVNSKQGENYAVILYKKLLFQVSLKFINMIKEYSWLGFFNTNLSKYSPTKIDYNIQLKSTIEEVNPSSPITCLFSWLCLGKQACLRETGILLTPSIHVV